MQRFAFHLWALVLCLAAPMASAQTRFVYIKTLEIPGFSQYPGHENEIEAYGLTFGFERPIAVQSRLRIEPGRGRLSTVVFYKQIDGTSPKLLLYSALGKVIPKLKISARRVGVGLTSDYLQIELEQVQVVAIDSAGDENGEGREQVTLGFRVVKVTYLPESGAAVSVAYDAVRGAQISPRK